MWGEARSLSVETNCGGRIAGFFSVDGGLKYFLCFLHQ